MHCQFTIVLSKSRFFLYKEETTHKKKASLDQTSLQSFKKETKQSLTVSVSTYKFQTTSAQNMSQTLQRALGMNLSCIIIILLLEVPKLKSAQMCDLQRVFNKHSFSLSLSINLLFSFSMLVVQLQQYYNKRKG